MKINDYHSEELQIFAEEYLRFDFEAGEIYWKKGRQGGGKAGSRAGSIWTNQTTGKQYRRITMGCKSYSEHRLLFCFFHKSSFEGFEIDHIDQNGLNNQIENLRSVTSEDNARNAKQREDNKSGYTGVCWDNQRQEWMARISADGRRINLGRFTKKREAIFRRRLAEIAAGYHPNHGRVKNQN